MRIVEVGPRDGLQNEKVGIPTEVKLRFIRSLQSAGLEEIEATSFVSPKWVPQLGDAAELWPQLPKEGKFSALVPNARGLERALECGVDRIAVFTAASESFVRRNINMTIAESVAGFREVVRRFRQEHPSGWVRGYVSTAFECPYEGRVSPGAVVAVANELAAICDEISLGDTIGVATPRDVTALISAIQDEFADSLERITFHFHDTYGTAIANVSRAIEMGIFDFDSSAGGLGGCPYAPGAGGNLATEDLVYFLEREGISTGVDLDRLIAASEEVLFYLGRGPASKVSLVVRSPKLKDG